MNTFIFESIFVEHKYVFKLILNNIFMIFKNQRNTNIEILRIISILFILFFHFLVFDLDKFHYTFSNQICMLYIFWGF